jgi:hypothetical protein
MDHPNPTSVIIPVVVKIPPRLLLKLELELELENWNWLEEKNSQFPGVVTVAVGHEKKSGATIDNQHSITPPC